MNVTSDKRAHFAPGQLVRHKLFNYRGVVVDVDADFQGTEEWYDAVALSRPPKDQPWYHVLVDSSNRETYVAERNLDVDQFGTPIQHPYVPVYFEAFENGSYVLHDRKH